MTFPLDWIAAVGGIAATAGTWTGPFRARWQLRAERLRTDEARREDLLHRQRFTEVWNWQCGQADGEERTEAARWYGEWTGAYSPRRADMGAGPQAPGLHNADADDAYKQYVEFLGVRYEPRRLEAS